MTWTHWMAALAVVFLAPAGADLETNYTKDRALHVASVSTFAMETTDFSMERDGEVVDRPFGGSGSRTTKRVETVDRVLEHEEGAPTRVRREFLAAGLESVTAFGDQEMEDERDGPLAGVTIEIAIGDNGDTEIEVVEGDEPEQDVALEGHEITLALDALLPDAAVSEGNDWELDRDQIMRALGLTLDGALFPRPERTEEEGEGWRGRRGRGGSGNRLLTEADWEGTALVASEDEEVEGLSCVVIDLEIEASGELAEPERSGRRGGFGLGDLSLSTMRATTYEIELEGRLAWSVEQGRPVLLELEGSVETTRLVEREGQGGSMRISTTQEGTLEVRIVVTEEAAEDE